MHAFRSSHATRGVYHRLVWREEGGARLRFEYDTEDRLTAVVNEAGERYTFTLNALGAGAVRGRGRRVHAEVRAGRRGSGGVGGRKCLGRWNGMSLACEAA